MEFYLKIIVDKTDYLINRIYCVNVEMKTK